MTRFETTIEKYFFNMYDTKRISIVSPFTYSRLTGLDGLRFTLYNAEKEPEKKFEVSYTWNDTRWLDIGYIDNEGKLIIERQKK